MWSLYIGVDATFVWCVRTRRRVAYATDANASKVSIPKFFLTSGTKREVYTQQATDLQERVLVTCISSRNTKFTTHLLRRRCCPIFQIITWQAPLLHPFSIRIMIIIHTTTYLPNNHQYHRIIINSNTTIRWWLFARIDVCQIHVLLHSQHETCQYSTTTTTTKKCAMGFRLYLWIDNQSRWFCNHVVQCKCRRSFLSCYMANPFDKHFSNHIYTFRFFSSSWQLLKKHIYIGQGFGGISTG